MAKYAIEAYLKSNEQAEAVETLLNLWHAGQIKYPHFSRLFAFVVFGWDLNLDERTHVRFLVELEETLGRKYRDHPRDPRQHFADERLPPPGAGHEDISANVRANYGRAKL